MPAPPPKIPARRDINVYGFSNQRIIIVTTGENIFLLSTSNRLGFGVSNKDGIEFVHRTYSSEARLPRLRKRVVKTPLNATGILGQMIPGHSLPGHLVYSDV